MNSASSTHATGWPRVTTWVALACLILSGIIFVRRGVAAWEASVIAPGTAVTSGCEEESLFAVWRAVHGQPVYADATRLPYATAYFNWLFYAAYAQPAKLAVQTGGDALIPRVGRLLTAVGGICGAAALFWLLWRAQGETATLAAAIAAFVYFGPLVGWWTHTVRPDVWALALETAALAVLLSNYRARPLVAAALSCVLFYGAWSFKQTYFFGLGAALLFLLLRRQWQSAWLLAAASVALWAATFALLGPAFRTIFLNAGADAVFYFAHGWNNFVNMLQKTFPLWLLAVIPLARFQEKSAATTLAGDVRLLGWLGLLIALPFTFVTSCKVGAYSNYYFTMLLMLAFVTVGYTSVGRAGGLVSAAFASALVLQLLLATDRIGQIDLTPQVRRHTAIWTTWQKEPEPRFAAVTSFNQPWLNPASPPLVLAYYYWQERQAGNDFEAGGIGGLIASGYFRSLLLPEATAGEYDGGRLSRYRRGETLNGLTVFHRQETFPGLK